MTTIISDEAVNIALNTWLGGVPAWRNNATERLRTEMRAALTAALPFLPVQGAVKKLEWVAHKGDQHCKIAWTCEGIGGWYAIEHRHEGHFDMWTPNNPDGGRFITLEAAKAAAQADYEARILSAIEPSAARTLALEEAARNAAMYLATGFITCPRCGEDVETKNTDAEYALRAALSSPDHADAGKVEGDGWLPIESAPKDGTEIIYLTKYGSIGFCRYAVDNINDWFGWWDLQADDEVYPKHWLSRSALPSALSEGAE
ncbi:hypothetical protein R5W60_04370 [Brucella pseudintermedia]|uniref:hypothetical protein n=1 Tax=Brucella pseudintermedia TaxID=370111 RepID=UPI00366C5BDF|nr:hypothetical protein R5W60_04370 [Brucella pseudintermedia]